MFTLNKETAKELTLKHLNPFMEDEEFKEKKRHDTGIGYRRETQNGFDGLAIGYLDSFPGQIIRYVVYKRVNIIEEITDDILKKTTPERKVDKESFTMVFNLATINGLKTDSFMPEMENEEDVIISGGLIKKFMTETGLPMLKKYDDIKELDKTINGDDFWADDWQMPFNMGGNFYIKRLVVAHLAHNPSFKNIVERVFMRDIELAKKYNLTTPSLSDDGSVLRATLEYFSK